MMPPPKTTMSAASRLQQLDHLGEQRHVRPGQHRQADGVGVLGQCGLHDLLRGLVQAGVDDLHAGVPQRSGDHLGAAVVAVQPRLGDDDSSRVELPPPEQSAITRPNLRPRKLFGAASAGPGGPSAGS
jgi:hypothetical protein